MRHWHHNAVLFLGVSLLFLFFGGVVGELVYIPATFTCQLLAASWRPPAESFIAFKLAQACAQTLILATYVCYRKNRKSKILKVEKFSFGVVGGLLVFSLLNGIQYRHRDSLAQESLRMGLPFAYWEEQLSGGPDTVPVSGDPDENEPPRMNNPGALTENSAVALILSGLSGLLTSRFNSADNWCREIARGKPQST